MDTPVDESQLQTVLREAQMGSSVAFGRVYGEFSGRVFGLCRKMLGSEAAAEDATSEVFERAYQALDEYDRERPFDRWILTIASRHCLNRLRRERLEKRLFQDEPLEMPGHFDSVNTAFWDSVARCYRSFTRYYEHFPENATL